MIEYDQSFTNFTWLKVSDPTSQDLDLLQKKYDITDELISYATDLYESPRQEKDKDYEMIIINTITDPKNRGKLKIEPVTFFIKDHLLISFTTNHSNFVLKTNKNSSKFFQNSTKTVITPKGIVLETIFNSTEAFLHELKEMDHRRNLLQQKIYRHRNNEYLDELLKLKVELVYDLNALQNNQNTLNEFYNNSQLKFNSEEKEFIEDILIEIKQAREMSRIASEITDLFSNTYSNLINNRTNRAMNRLTIASIVLAIPAIVVGFFGMNVKLPGENTGDAWLYITFGTGIVMFFIYYLLKKHGFFD